MNDLMQTAFFTYRSMKLLIFLEKENHKRFMRFVHVSIILLNIGLSRLVQLTVTNVASIIKWLIMCFIWIRSFFSSVRLSLLCVLFIMLKLKQHSIFFIDVQLLNFFGINFYYFLKQILTSLFNTVGYPIWFYQWIG